MSSTPLSARVLHGTSLAVVGMSYAPEPTGIAPYTAATAEILAAHGARVSVVAGVPHYPSWTVRPEDRWRLRSREVRGGVHVQRARHFVPARQSAVGRLLWEATFLVNAGTVRPPAAPHAVLGVSPSLSGAYAGLALARRHGVPLAVVVQDLVGLAARNTAVVGGRVARAAAQAEGRVLRAADRVVVVSDSFRGQVAEYGVEPGAVRLLPNWTHIAPPHRPRQEVRALLGWPDDVFVVLHTGNMGAKQGLGTVVEAARALGDRRDVRFVLMGDGNQRPVLEQAAAGVTALQMTDPVDGDLYPDVLAAADLLLVNELPTVGEMSLPSKLTSYFSAGVAVLAAVSAEGACAREVERSGGAGLRVEPGDPAALVEAVVTLRTEPERLRALGEAGRRYSTEVLGRGRAEQAVVELVQDLLQVRPRRHG